MIKHSSLRWRASRQKQSHRKLFGDCFVTSFLAMTVFILIFSCGQKEKQVAIPVNILPKEKMAQVLTDIHLAEAEANLHISLDTSVHQKINFQEIFKKDTITKQQYEESLSFYVDHPEMLNKVYEQVLNELSKMQGTPSK